MLKANTSSPRRISDRVIRSSNALNSEDHAKIQLQMIEVVFFGESWSEALRLLWNENRSLLLLSAGLMFSPLILFFPSHFTYLRVAGRFLPKHCPISRGRDSTSMRDAFVCAKACLRQPASRVFYT